MRFRALVVAVGLFFVSFAPGAVQAQDRPGDFDFYVLSLSWSPTYCASGRRTDPIQCDGPRPFAFVVHGLWPQYERGYPSECRTAGNPTRDVVDGMLDIMPSPGLVRHEWRTHGTCSGLGPSAYFNTVRKAREAVTIPEAYRAVDQYLTTSPADIERAFIAANPGLQPSGIAVDCNRRNLREVRICMKKDLSFRPCAEVDRRSCRADSIVLPPVRGE